MKIQTNPYDISPSPAIKLLVKSLPKLDDLELDIHWFVRKDSPNVLRISAEHGEDSGFVLDYYSTGMGLDISPDMKTMKLVKVAEAGPYIHPKLIEWATDNGGFWEWENPSNIAFYRV